MRTLLFAALAIVQAAPTLQFRGPQSGHAVVVGDPPAVAVRPGEKAVLFVDVTPKPKIHVYAPGSKDYIPITVKFDRPTNVKIGKLTYPPAETMMFADEKVPVFQKPFRLTQEVTVSGSIKPGTTVPVAGTVNYQACDDRVCFPPESAPVSWTLTVK
jgi:DsbC/DsbD-like thiol-disulfide interchange protein